MAVIFVTGPARSGKSAYGVRLALESGLDVTYVATAAHEPDDAEWHSRLARHLRDRPATWRTLEIATMSHEAQVALFRDATPQQCLLVDALGTYLAARIGKRIELLEVDYAVLEGSLDREAAEFADAMVASPAHVIAVSEQIGWDVPPPTPAGRLLRDTVGRMTQHLAARADRTYLVVAGYAIDLRATGRPIVGEAENA